MTQESPNPLPSFAPPSSSATLSVTLPLQGFQSNVTSCPLVSGVYHHPSVAFVLPLRSFVRITSGHHLACNSSSGGEWVPSAQLHTQHSHSQLALKGDLPVVLSLESSELLSAIRKQKESSSRQTADRKGGAGLCRPNPLRF